MGRMQPGHSARAQRSGTAALAKAPPEREAGRFTDALLGACERAIRQVIALAAEPSEDERRVVVDAIAPREPLADFAAECEAENERRAERAPIVQSQAIPEQPAFAESKLPISLK